MEAGLVGHRELTYQSGSVGKFVPEFLFAAAETFAEQLIEPGFECLPATHEADEAGDVFLHLPEISPAVVLIIVVTAAGATVEFGIDVDPVAFVVFGQEK